MAANSRLAVGLHAMVALAYRAPERVSSDELAFSVRTNPVVMRRVIAALARRGLVRISKGRSGGAELARAPSQISVYEVYAALGDGGRFALHAQQAEPSCKVSCAMKGILTDLFQRADAALEHELRRTRLSELVAKVE